jgi:hypothetical protein
MEVHDIPHLVVEVISLYSAHADQVEMRDLYHKAGIPEYWLVNAREEEIDFPILAHRRRGFVSVTPKDGWHKSRIFGCSFRLERRRNRLGRWQYKLHVKTP